MKNFVIGLGTGRCGTKSLSKLLNGCRNCNISHEFRRYQVEHKLPWYFNLEKANNRLSLLKELEGLLIGDVASYYLNYLPFFFENIPGLKVIYLIRDAAQVIESFDRLTNQQRVCHWLTYNRNSGYRKQSAFSICFPKLDYAQNKREAIAEYCKLYHLTMKEHIAKYNNILTIYIEQLNQRQVEIFDFLEILIEYRKYQLVWENKSNSI